MDEQTETPKRVLLTCKRCGYRWFGRSHNGRVGGRVCPGCKSCYWNDEKELHLYHKAKYRGDVPKEGSV